MCPFFSGTQVYLKQAKKKGPVPQSKVSQSRSHGRFELDCGFCKSAPLFNFPNSKWRWKSSMWCVFLIEICKNHFPGYPSQVHLFIMKAMECTWASSSCIGVWLVQIRLHSTQQDGKNKVFFVVVCHFSFLVWTFLRLHVFRKASERRDPYPVWSAFLFVPFRLDREKKRKGRPRQNKTRQEEINGERNKDRQRDRKEIVWEGDKAVLCSCLRWSFLVIKITIRQDARQWQKPDNGSDKTTYT